MVGYFSVDEHHRRGYIDWEWLLAQPPMEEMEFTRLLRFHAPVLIKINGQHSRGVILKPGNSHA
jgi:hypothetical protein